MKRGQFSIVAAVTIAVALMIIASLVYQAQVTFVEVRTPVVREVVGAITADFKRALSEMLAVATRCYFNYSEYKTLCTRYQSAGLDYSNRHNMTVARAIALNFLNTWRLAVMDAYSGYGVEVDYELVNMPLQHDRPYRVLPADPEKGLLKGYWYYPDSISVAAAKLKLNLKTGGFYGWESLVVVSLQLFLDPYYFVIDNTNNSTTIRFRVLQDWIPYSYLFDKGRIRIYYPKKIGDTIKWVKVPRRDYENIEYLGDGLYKVTFKPALYKIKIGESDGTPIYTVPVAVAVEDERGIITTSVSYTATGFAIKRMTPLKLYVPLVTCSLENKYWSASISSVTDFELSGFFRVFSSSSGTKQVRIELDSGGSQVITAGPNRVIRIDAEASHTLSNGDLNLRWDNNVLDLRLHVSQITVRIYRVTWWGLILSETYSFDGATVYINNMDITDLYEESTLNLTVTGVIDSLNQCSYQSGNKYTLTLLNLYPREINRIELNSNTLALSIDSVKAERGYLEETKEIDRSTTPWREVYTLEMAWNTSIYWLGTKLGEEGEEVIAPIPLLPVKQLRVNVTLTDDPDSLNETPVQYEVWETYPWPQDIRAINVSMPRSLADPTMDYNESIRLVFQVDFTNDGPQKKYVVIWWYDDLDVEPGLYRTNIEFRDERPSVYDIRHPLYSFELVDLNHPRSRSYSYNYRGVATVVIHDSQTDFSFGPWNLYAAGTCGGLGCYRPYGQWEVYSHYLGKYSDRSAPIRIFAKLDTRNVYCVEGYTCSGIKPDLYDSLILLQIINDTNYVPVIAYFYWRRPSSTMDVTPRGLWFSTLMGGGFPKKFVTLRYGTNDTVVGTYYFDDIDSNVNPDYYSRLSYRCFYNGEWVYPWSVAGYKEPGFFSAHWDENIGRAIIFNEEGLEYLNSQSKPMFGTTHFAYFRSCSDYAEQFSLEHWAVWHDTYINVGAGTLHNYRVSLLAFSPTQGYTGNWEIGWLNAYIYSPMFLEKYAPVVEKTGPIKYPELPSALTGASTTFELNTTRQPIFSGSIEFIATSFSRLRIAGAGGSLDLKPGDQVVLVVHDVDEGVFNIASDGYVTIQNLNVEEIWVNGIIRRRNVRILSATDLIVEVSSILSDLLLEVPSTSSGYTYLAVNGTTVIDGETNTYITVRGLTASETQDLIIRWASSETYATGLSKTVETSP